MPKEIFVVEDDRDDIELIERAFTEAGRSDVRYFSDALQFLKYLKGETANVEGLLVTDYKMPKIDGFNLVAYLKREVNFCNMTIVMLTGTMTPIEEQRLITTGVTKVYMKPHSFEGYKKLAAEIVQVAEAQ